MANSLAQETIVIQLPTECNSAFTAKKEGVALFRARLSVRRIEPCVFGAIVKKRAWLWAISFLKLAMVSSGCALVKVNLRLRAYEKFFEDNTITEGPDADPLTLRRDVIHQRCLRALSGIRPLHLTKRTSSSVATASAECQ